MSKATTKSVTPSGAATLTDYVEKLNVWRQSYNPLRGLTLRRAVEMMESYFRGEMADLQWTYFFIEQTDPDLIALLELRFASLLEMDYNIQKSEDADETLAVEQAAFLRERFEAIDNLYEVIEHLGMAAFRGYAHCEKWLTNGVLTHLELVDQWNVVRNGLRGGWKYNPEAKSASFATLPVEAEMNLENFIVRDVRRPINRFALLKFVRSNLSEKDWDAFNEIYGIPNGVVIGPPNIPQGKEAEYADSARKIAYGGSGYLPNGASFVANVAARGMQPFKERLDHLSEKLVLVGTCGKLTMLNGPTGLGGGQSGVHQDVFGTIGAAEARRISELFNRQLVKGWLDERFQGYPQVAYFALAANEETDVGAVVDHALKLKQAGYQMDPAQLSEKTGYAITLSPAPVSPSNPDQPQLMDPDNPPISNRAASSGNDVRFLEQATRRLDDAEQAAMKPLLDKVTALDGLSDSEFAAACIQLQKDLPYLEETILADHPELEEAFTEVIGTAFVSGLAEAAHARAPEGSQGIKNKAPRSPLSARMGMRALKTRQKES